MSVKLISILILSLIPSVVFAKHVYPKSLKTVENGTTYVLQEDYKFQEKSATFTLSAGSFKLAYEDSSAHYLIGLTPQCLEMRVVPPKYPENAWSDKWDCGIFLPKDDKKGAAFFMIRKTPNEPKSSNQGPIIDAIIKAGYGSFDFPTSTHKDAVLRSKLVVQ
ncbi:hypothetical protein GCM10011613_31830 [Cellvibrio zantedeschiae]|uniref:Uncharacterized protein n=1 Tax=Cellvibrio zantedeschiae TaxID=1237077 RepID=A0ABQ3B8D5_9GAMM|nr:hypothetical protein [Cellvibrio zantedeschiae]GGY84519.1 hypothetical protein GCM10011613_31830 [Cellvibrio zantedeschiae]